MKAFTVDAKGRLFAVTGSNKINYSTDNGDSWSEIHGGLESETAFTSIVCAMSSNTMLLGTSQNIYKLDNNTNQWSSVYHADAMAIFESIAATSGGRVFAGSWMAGLMYSDDLTNWTKVSHADLQGKITDVYIAANGYIYVLSANSSDKEHKLFVSKDNGDSWTLLKEQGDHKFKSVFAFGNYIALGTQGGGVLISIDGGSAWIEASQGLGMEDNIRAFTATADGNLLVATANYIFKSDGINGVEENILSFNNDMVYPNPANDICALDFNLSKAATINVVISDITGAKVKEIFSGKYFHEGANRINVQTIGLPNGTYFVNIETESGIKSVKIQVAR